MPLLGLIGYPLNHSFSPGYFKQKFEALGLIDWQYKAIPIEQLRELPELINLEPELIAFNVTIPHKQTILSYCQEQDESVKKVGAANLILIKRTNNRAILKAYNTDLIGFSNSLNRHLTQKPEKALIMGTGGSSLAVKKALELLNISFLHIGRYTSPTYNQISLGDFDLIINCTPVGMHPIELHGSSLPLDFNQAKTHALYFDLVYNPEKTKMM
ncbi:MAG: shikimate dehydrogenase [Bacteroidia bacterium]|nr:shikimate dehydrogenase [Bacteroidia bacterium]